MAEVNLAIHPKTLADGLANAFTCGKERSKAVKPCPTVLLAYEEDAAGPALFIYGMGRYIGGRTRVPIEGSAAGVFPSVSVSRENADALQSMLRKAGSGANGAPVKGDTISVVISDEPKQIEGFDETGAPVQKYVNLVVATSTGSLAELSDADPEGKFDTFWDFVDRMIRGEVDHGAERMAFVVDVITRLKDMKTDGPVLDLKRTGHDRVAAVAIGSNFRGVVGNVGREVYAEGGPWKDGPGLPEHLLN